MVIDYRASQSQLNSVVAVKKQELSHLRCLGRNDLPL